MSTQRWKLSLLLVLALLASGASIPMPAHAGGVVTVCNEAHLLAALAGGGTVTFACSGVITLNNTITIAADTTIDGSGQDVTISGKDAMRVLLVSAGVVLNLNSVTIAHGAADTYQDGGGALNNGTLSLTHCTFRNNNSGGIGGGGGIRNHGLLIASRSTFSDNTAIFGGGISNGSGTVLVSDSVFSGNIGQYDGGGIANGVSNVAGLVTVSGTTFSDNYGHYSGGGIYNTAMLTVTTSIFAANTSSYSSTGGGGIFNSGTSTVSDSTFSGNGASRGGAMYNMHVLRVSNSTLAGNSAGCLGGGIYTRSALTVSNSTFSQNSADFCQGGGGGIYVEEELGIAALRNTIMADNHEGANCAGGIVINGGGNLSFPDTTCPGINADPLLGPLQDNGGPTWTMALGEGSAAIDAGDDAICAAPPVNNLDQRGLIRPQGTHCDIGALEQIIVPSAVSLDAISAGSAPGGISPLLVFVLLLAGLAGAAESNRNHR